MLDIILTNEEGLLHNLAYLPPLGNSDHLVLQFDLVCYAQPADTNETRLNLNKGDFQRLNMLVKQSMWTGVYSTNPDTGYSSFKDTLANLVSICIPKARPKGKRCSIYMNKEAIRLKNNKKRLWSEYTHTRDDISYARYVRCKNDLRRLTRKWRKGFEHNLAVSLKDNPKGF